MSNSSLDLSLEKRLSNPSTRSKAFSELVVIYQERLYWHIRKMVITHDDANDILQNTFLKAWNGMDGFRGEARISTWLYRIATNETLTFLANQRQKYNLSIDDEQQYLNNLPDDGYLNGNELQIELQKAIKKLPEKQRIIFNMRYFDELSYDQISEILETSVGALKASYHHAVKKIEKHFENIK